MQTVWAGFEFLMGEAMRKSAISALAVAASLGFFAPAGGAMAADLGGGCCGDLEERVAELEATTARKGNRQVTLTITGQVTKELLVWDDGVRSDAYVTDNAINTSLFTLNGKAKIADGVTAGYLMQVNVGDSGSNFVTQGKNGDENPAAAPDISLRTNNLYIESERFGKIAIGQNYSLNDAVHVSALFPIANTYNTDGTPYSDSFKIMTSAGGETTLSWSSLVGNGPRRNDYVRYDSPAIAGFVLTALAGDNDVWEVGASYKGKLGDFQISAAADYFHYDAEPLGAGAFLTKFQETAGILAVKHAPSGVFVSLWAAKRDYTRENFVAAPTANGLTFEDTGHSFSAMLGVERKWLPYGNTTIYGQYGIYKNMAATGLSAASLNLAVNGLSNDDYVANSTVRRLNFGIVQTFDSAGLDVFAMVERDEADVTVGDVGSNLTSKASLEDWTGVMVGSRIKF